MSEGGIFGIVGKSSAGGSFSAVSDDTPPKSSAATSVEPTSVVDAAQTGLFAVASSLVKDAAPVGDSPTFGGLGYEATGHWAGLSIERDH